MIEAGCWTTLEYFFVRVSVQIISVDSAVEHVDIRRPVQHPAHQRWGSYEVNLMSMVVEEGDTRLQSLFLVLSPLTDLAELGCHLPFSGHFRVIKHSMDVAFR